MTHKLIPAAVIALLGAMASVPAQAAALSAADLTVSQIGLVDSSNNPFGGTITILGESRSGTVGTQYNGVSIGSTPPSSGVIGSTVDIAAICNGDCGAATTALYGGVLDNNFTTHITPTPFPTSNFALGDMYLAGSAIGNPAAAQGMTRANAVATGTTNVGSSGATILNGVDLTSTFAVSATFTGRITLLADAYLRAFVTSPPVVGQSESASASLNFQITINDDQGNQVLSFRPNQLNRGFNVRTGGANTDQGASFNGFLSSDLVTFDIGRTYSLTISQASNANISSVPEPMSIALIGAALLAAGAATRSAQRKQ